MNQYRMQLETFPVETLLRWSDSLNRWKWPDDIPIPDPLPGLDPNKRETHDAQFRDATYRGVVEALNALTTPADRSRYHWLNNLGETAEAWAVWWEREGRRTAKAFDL